MTLVQVTSSSQHVNSTCQLKVFWYDLYSIVYEVGADVYVHMSLCVCVFVCVYFCVCL